MTAHRTGLLLSSAAAALAAIAPASAQTMPDASSTDESVIIVTAQKREQTLIDVPQSISVVSGDQLRGQQATSFQDYLKLVPGLSIDQATPGQTRLTIRGLNTGGVASTVAVYLDEAPFGSSTGLANGAILAGDFDTFDVARIEVLRGPQGTLYGSSSLGGVFKFVTTAPELGKFGARGRAALETVKGGDASYAGNAVINVPLGETLAVRASGFYRNNTGFIDSIGTGGSRVRDNVNRSRNYGGRVGLLFKPSETFSLRLNALLQNIESKAPTFVESDPATLSQRYGRPTQSIFVQPFRNINYRLYNATADFDLGFATLTSASTYSTQKQSIRDDLTTQLGGTIGFLFQVPAAGATPARFLSNELYLRQNTNLRKYTQEIRLASSKSDVFEWLVGGYYSNEKALIFQQYVAVIPGTLTPITTLPPGTVSVLAGNAPVTTLPLLAQVNLNSKYEEVAGFANATVHLGDRFDIDFGGRYSHNKQTATQALAGVLVGGASSYTQPSSENVFTYSVAPKFKFGDRASLYARVAKGFRPGGPNALGPGAPAAARSYKSDQTVNYEVGFKAETADRKLSVDISAYHIDWSRIQLLTTIQTVAGPFNFNGNGGKARSDGAEFTIVARPTPGLVVSANGSYINARLTADAPAASGLKGDKLPFTPEYSVGLNGDYRWNIGGSTEAFFGGSLRFLSKQVGGFDRTYRGTYGRRSNIPSYEVVDLRAGVDLGRATVEVYAKNITDAKGITAVGALGQYPAGAIGVGVINPRTFGIALTASY
ncbi:TonB-dependent receptor [Sphingomonas sp.]|uniref:TonB-dependent receptor n=1 Tax=Sphingomonas sp. TaxID=28214 RepID=UPI0025D8CA0D|nr:TonB-dependent receptor [Sphingomonas sp.]